jgi:hypothetical protein
VEEINYVSYILRFWPVRHDSGVTWRVSLENSQTGERLGFPNLEAFIRHVEDTFTPEIEPDQIERNAK